MSTSSKNGIPKVSPKHSELSTTMPMALVEPLQNAIAITRAFYPITQFRKKCNG